MATLRLPPDIPRVYSRPEDPNAVSFLTLLPENPNRIYELLLQSTGQMLIQHPKDTADEAHTEEFLDTAEIKKGVAILRTCRQVFHEAAGILYGQNTFHVARMCPFTCKNPRFSNIAICAVWMRSISSAVRLLRRLVVELDCHDLYGRRFPSGGWLTNHKPIDLYPIISVL